MSFPPGTRLGPYEIVSSLGAGGMGEVFRAKDPRLSREVAIKVLPESFAKDADRLRRFEQEARAAGLLNHPNVTAVFDVGMHDGSPYLVEELLEGETLRALAGGRLPVRRAVEYAIQIARGLAAAHERGIVHRDLKPENVFVTRDGRVKILDFGLAKLTRDGERGDVTGLPTETHGTDPGTVMGTLGYMSPEQVRGLPADARSDLFAFGAILYEMLAGQRAFKGDSAADTISAILREEPPDLSVTNKGIPPGLERIVRHCLEKRPEQRLQSAHDVAFDLEALSTTSAPTAALAAPRARRLSPAALLGAGLLLGASLGALVVRVMSARASSSSPAATFRRITNLSGYEISPSLSPDGRLLAFVHRGAGSADVWLQALGSQRPTNVTPDCDRGSGRPAFSPDGSLVAYPSQCGEGGLFVMGPSGENPRRVTSFGADPTWSPDGREIVFSTEPVQLPYGRLGSSELWAVEVASGKTRRILGEDAIQPSVSPHGRRIAYWALPPGGSQRDIWTVPYRGLGKGESPVAATRDAAIDWSPVWAPDGRSLYFLSNRDGTMNLWRVPIDEETGRPLGPPEPDRLPAREVGGIAFSKDGRQLAYVDRQRSFQIERLVFDTEGRLVGKPEEITRTSQEMADMDVSPDGSVLVVDSRGSVQDDLYVLGVGGTGLRRLMDDEAKDRAPTFAPDGRRVAFHSDRAGKYEIWSIALDGSGLAQMTTTPGTTIEPHYSPDGRWLLARSSEEGGLVFPLDASGKAGAPRPIPPPAPGTVTVPLAWSSDGRHAYGATVRVDTQATVGLFTFEIATGTTRAVPGVATEGRAFRGAALGQRLVYGDERGIHVCDMRTGADRLVAARANATLVSIACRNGSCFAVRGNDDADVWLRTLPEPAR